MSGVAMRQYSDARLRVPVASDTFLHRPRLVAHLDDALALDVTLVTGPAGAGKTLAVADWTRAGRTPGTVAWLSLDRGDASLARFWQSLKASLLAAGEFTVFAGLEMPDVPDASLLRDVAVRMGGTLVVVLDDLQEAEDGDALDWLGGVLRWPPAGVKFVLISRHDPPVPLYRLRADGMLGELRLADLALSKDEAGELLDKLGVAFDEASLTWLMAATQGWPAAVRLAALGLGAPADLSAVQEHGAGASFLVSEFLWDEVLHVLPSQYGEFLLRTSVSERLCASLAVALTDEPCAGQILRTLAHDQLLTYEVEDTGWYRTHRLLTQVLNARLRSDRPDQARDMHRRAALWFEEQRAWLPALEHAIASGDWDFTGQIATRSGAVAFVEGDRSEFVRLLAEVPRGVVFDHPELIVAAAAAAFCRGDAEAVGSLTARAESALVFLPEPRRSIARLVIRVIQAYQASRVGEAAAMLAAAVEADDLITGLSTLSAPGWAHIPGLTTGLRGTAELWCGHPGPAHSLLRVAAEILPAAEPFTAFSAVVHRGLLALAECTLGRISAARATAEAALDLARRHGPASSHESLWAWLALAIAKMHAGDDSARSAMAKVAEIAPTRSHPLFTTMLPILTARRALAAGNLRAARRSLAEAEAAASGSPRLGLLIPFLACLRVDVALAAGDVDLARTVLAQYDRDAPGSSGAPAPDQDMLANCRARCHLAAGEVAAVQPVVAHLLTQTGAEAAQAWVAVGLAENRLRNDAGAIEATARALDLAVAEGVVLPFLPLSPQLAAALRRHLDVVGTHRDFVTSILAMAPCQGVVPAVELPIAALTQRELAVLTYLPTMGSNSEIADALRISENTVKQHLKSIYRKLSVTSRREAVRVARSSGLLDLMSRTGSLID